jgi:hypothetical protein
MRFFGLDGLVPMQSSDVTLSFEGSSSISVQTDWSFWVQTTVSAY